MPALISSSRLKGLPKSSLIPSIHTPASALPPASPAEKYELILINPGISVSTRRIYDEVDKRFSFKKEDYDSEKTSADIFLAQKNNKYNIMQALTLDLYDEAKEIYDYMKRNLNADMVMMSGSGPTMVAYYSDKEIADKDFIKAKIEASGHEGWKVFRTVSGR